MKNLTAIIPVYNCQEELDSSLSNLVDKDKINIIVVDDGSRDKIKVPPGVQLIRHERNLGVGAAFDSGVRKATTENLILMGADVIPDDGWYNNAMETLTTHPMAITCSISSGFTDTAEPFRKGRPMRYGAHILRTHQRKWGNIMLNDIIQAKWNSRIPEWEGDVGRIGCILGAFYLTTKTLYNQIGGWMGHKHWGGLEPMISLRAKRCGFPLYVSRTIEAAHHFGRTTASERPPQWPIYFYNKIFMAETMFVDPKTTYAYLYKDGANNWVRKGHTMIQQDMKAGIIQDIRQYHKQNWPLGLIKNDEEL